MRIAILTDTLANKGGMERLVLKQSKVYDADIITGKYYPDRTFEEFKNRRITTLLPSKPHSSFDTINLWRKFASLKLDYDFYIFHGIGPVNAAKNCKPNLWYCHSPSRYLYDLYEEELAKRKWPYNLFFEIATNIMRYIDQKNVKHVDTIVTNSKNVKKRVFKYYNRFAKVVYPFVDTNKFKFIKQGDFFLSSSRLDPIKRVDLVVKAFQKMPNEKLVVISHGPAEREIEALCATFPNITFEGAVSDERLAELYGTCKAGIFLSHKEDFGMVPIECMSAGKPAIATNDGGFKESIKHLQTGYLVDDPTDFDQIQSAVLWLTDKRVAKMKKACEERAEEFSIHNHFVKLGGEIK